MVRAKSDKHNRRNKGAGPARPGSRQFEGDSEPVDRYPNMRAHREMDRQQHIKAARAMGATRGQASRHADEEVGGH